MRLDKIISNDPLNGELKHAEYDTNNTQIYNDNSINKETALQKVKFKLSALDSIYYLNELTIIIVYLMICLIFIKSGGIFTLLSPISMFCLLVLLSSNPIELKNNKLTNLGLSNLLVSFNMVLKSFGLSPSKISYKSMTSLFTKLFTFSLLLSGHPSFNLTFIIISHGLILSYFLCFINNDIEDVRKSGDEIKSKELLYIIASSILFAFIFKTSAINTTIFTTVCLLNYFQKALKATEENF